MYFSSLFCCCCLFSARSNSEQVFELYLHVRQIQDTKSVAEGGTRCSPPSPTQPPLSVPLSLTLSLCTDELLKFYVNVHNYFKLYSKFIVCNGKNIFIFFCWLSDLFGNRGRGRDRCRCRGGRGRGSRFALRKRLFVNFCDASADSCHRLKTEIGLLVLNMAVSRGVPQKQFVSQP